MADDSGFTATEVIGHLPGGWTLADAGDPGGWEASGRRWRTRLVDGADVARELVVEAAAIASHGRIEALRREVDRLYRRALR
jgi:hypothetical protein